MDVRDNISSNNKFIFLSLLLFLMIFNRISVDIGFRLTPIYMLLPFLIGLLFIINRFRIRRFTSVEQFAFYFYFYAILTSLNSYHVESSFRFIMGFFLTSGTYLVVRYYIVREVNYLDKVVWLAGVLFVFGGVVNYLIGLSVMNVFAEHVDFWGVTIEKAIPRMIGFNNDPNILAFSSLIFFFFFFSKSGKINNFVAGVCFFCIIASMSRGGLVALILGMFSIFLLKRGKEFIKYLFILCLIISVVLLFFYFNYDSLHLLVEKRISGLSSGGGRFAIWNNSLIAFQEKPIFGYGIFTFKEVMGDMFNDPRHAHNTYIEVLFETGVVGVVLYLSFIFFMLLNSFKLAVKYTTCRFLFPCNVAVFVAMAGLSMYINPMFWFLLLLNTAYYYHVVIHYPPNFNNNIKNEI
jgi:O-antigen ligase